MTAAQELFDLLKDARPSTQKHRENKPPARVKTGLRTTNQAAPTVPLYARIPPTRVELPKLGGCVEILYTWDESEGV